MLETSKIFLTEKKECPRDQTSQGESIEEKELKGKQRCRDKREGRGSGTRRRARVQRQEGGHACRDGREGRGAGTGRRAGYRDEREGRGAGIEGKAGVQGQEGGQGCRNESS